MRSPTRVRGPVVVLGCLACVALAGALARTQRAIADTAPDAPGYPAAGTLFPFGHGVSYGLTAPGSTGPR